jgi:hypothetical protein
MPTKDRELREAMRLGIKTLIVQEVRLLRLERTFTPHFVVDEMSHSIQDAKKEIVKLTKAMAQKERVLLLKRMIRQAVDEEIDRAIRLRGTKCIRCLHGRFYDERGTPHLNLPIGTSEVRMVGCDKLQPSLRKRCRRFVEAAGAISLEDYLNELTLLYEFRELIGRIEEIWKEYLTR